MNVPILKFLASKTDHYLGSLQAPVIIVEYADFESEDSARAAIVLKEIFDDFREDVCLVFRHFPQNKIHSFAGTAAVAAEAAGLQGQFWEMHDALFENVDHLEGDEILVLGREIGLEMRDYQNDLERPELAVKVQNQHRSGVESGVMRAPTIFINGPKYAGPMSFDALKRHIRGILESLSQSRGLEL